MLCKETCIHRLCTPYFKSVIICCIYIHSLFILALFGQNIISTILLIIHLITLTRFVGEKMPSHDEIRKEEETNININNNYINSIDDNINSINNNNNNNIYSTILREPVPQHLPLLPPRLLIFINIIYSFLQILLTVILGPILGKFNILQGWKKVIFNSIGVWSTSDIFPFVMNIVLSVILTITGIILYFIMKRGKFILLKTPNRSFTRTSLLRLAILTLLTSIIYPSYDFSLIFIIHFLCMISFLLSKFVYMRIRFLEIISKLCSVIGILLLIGALLAQSPLEQKLLLSYFYNNNNNNNNEWNFLWYESKWINAFTNFNIFRKSIQFLFLMYTIISSRLMHGNWSFINKTEIEEHEEYINELPFLLWHILPLGCPAKVKKFQLSLSYYLPFIIIPILIFVSLSTVDMVSIVMIITSLMGFIFISSTFVKILPYCYIFISLGIILEFIACVNHKLRQPFFMMKAMNEFTLLFIIIIHSCVASLLVLTFSIFRENTIGNYYKTYLEKKTHIRKAVNYLNPRLMELQEIFRHFCDSSTGIVNRCKFKLLLKETSYTLQFQENDIECIWRFLTEGEAIFLHEGVHRIDNNNNNNNNNNINILPNYSTLEENNIINDNNNNIQGRVYQEVIISSHNSTNEDIDMEESEEIKEWNKLKQRLISIQVVTDKSNNKKTESNIRNKIKVSNDTNSKLLVEEEEEEEEEEKRENNNTIIINKSKDQRPRASSIAIHAVGSPGGNIAYLDFLVLVHEIECYRMQNSHFLYIIFVTLKQIIYFNTSTFFLVAMFSASMTVKYMDFLNSIYLLFFIGLACLPQHVQYCWYVIMTYTSMHIMIRFIFIVYSESYKFNSISEFWINILGIRTDTNPFSILPYFILLYLAVLQKRYFNRKIKGNITIQEIFYKVEWRRYISSDFFPKLRQHFFTGSIALILAMIAIFIPRNIFIAGFALLFLAYLSLGGYSKKAENIALIILSVYNIMVLLISAIFHFPIISNSIVEKLSNIIICQNITVVECASEIGLPIEDRQGPVSFDLLPWYLAASLCVALCRERFSKKTNIIDDEIENNNNNNSNNNMLDEREMNNIYEPLVVNNSDNNNHEEEKKGERDNQNSINIKNEKIISNIYISSRSRILMNRMSLFFTSYTENFGTFTGKCVPLAFELTRYFYIIIAAIYEFGYNYGELLVWVTLGYASLNSFSVLGAAFMLMFIFNICGPPVIIISVFSMTLNYVYPFFFIPAVPLSDGVKLFLGLQKNPGGGGGGAWGGGGGAWGGGGGGGGAWGGGGGAWGGGGGGGGAWGGGGGAWGGAGGGSPGAGGIGILPALLACAAAVFYKQTEKSPEARQREREARRVRIHSEDPRQRRHEVYEEGVHNNNNNNNTCDTVRFNEDLQTPYVAFEPYGTEENIGGTGRRENVVRFSTFRQHLEFLWNYIRRRFFIDTSFEIVLLIVIIGISLTLDRITGFIFSMQFLISWIIGRVRSTTELRFALGQEFFILLSIGILYIIRLGMPDGFINFSILHYEECKEWDYYFGCQLPVHHFILMFTLVIMQRYMRKSILKVRETILCVEGCLELGELLRKKSKDVDNCRRLIRSDIENVLPIPSRDIIRDPQTVFDLLISISCAFLPAATFAFIQGVIMASLLGVLEIVVSLCLLAFKRFLAWRWHIVWPYFTLSLFITFIPQLIIRLPFFSSFDLKMENVMISLGINPWTGSIIAGQSVVLFFAIVQQRIFNEFFFAAYLIGLCHGSLTAVERRKEMLAYILTRNKALQEKVAEQEKALRNKLEELFAERKMLARRFGVGSDILEEEEEFLEYNENGRINEIYKFNSPKSILLSSTALSHLKSPVLNVSVNSGSYFDNKSPVLSIVSNRKLKEDKEKKQEEIVEENEEEIKKHSELKDDVDFNSFNRKNDVKTPETQISDIFSVENIIHEKDEKKNGICNRISNTIYSWSEGLILFFSSHTYRGKIIKGNYSQGYLLLLSFMHFIMAKSAYICYFCFMLNYAMSGTLLDLLLSLSAALHGMLMLPWAGKFYWRNILIYNVISILAKCVMQVIIKQFYLSDKLLFWLSACVLDIGLNRSKPSSRAMTLDIIMDFIVFVSIMIHRQLCFDYGIFGDEGDKLIRQKESLIKKQKKIHSNKNIESINENKIDEDKNYHSTTNFQENQRELIDNISKTSIKNNQNNNNNKEEGDVILDSKVNKPFKSGNILQKYWRNICERHGAGSDYYTLQFWADSLSLIVFVAVYFVMAGNSRGNIVYSVQQDLLPGPLVIILFLAVLLMAAERIVYVLHSVYLKFILHTFTALGYHITFIIWRLTLAQDTTTAAAILLFIKFFSMFMSALQLRKGYPLYRKHDPFTTNTDIFHWLGHTIYKVIPFLFELRLLLDWSASPTSLKIQHWMLLEDIHHTIYQRYVDMSDLIWTSPHKGHRFPFLVKAYQGVVGFTACLLVLFFPLLLYSTFNPNVVGNQIASWRIEITFGTTTSFYNSEITNVEIPENMLNNFWKLIPKLEQEGFGAEGSLQLLMFPKCSAYTWAVTPETQLLLLGQLNSAAKNETDFIIYKHNDLIRLEASSGSPKQIRITKKYITPWNTVIKLRDALEKVHNIKKVNINSTTSSFTYTSSEWISLPDFYSPFIKNSPSGVVTLDYGQTDCAIQLNTAGTNNNNNGLTSVLYWCIQCKSLVNLSMTSSSSSSDNNNNNNNSITSSSDNKEEINITDMYEIVASSDVAPKSSLSFLPNTGIVALYTTFILALGTFLRNGVTGYAGRVVLMQVANPDPIAELLRYIYLARSGVSNGHQAGLILEQQLFLELVDLLRSPERVLVLSGRRVEDYDGRGKFQQHLRDISEHPF